MLLPAGGRETTEPHDDREGCIIGSSKGGFAEAIILIAEDSRFSNETGPIEAGIDQMLASGKSCFVTAAIAFVTFPECFKSQADIS
jgi:hypothetical protein